MPGLSRVLIAASVSLASFSAPVLAADICGLAAETVDGKDRVSIGTYTAFCEQQGKCGIEIAETEGVGMSLERAATGGSWLAVFDGKSSIDSGAGVDLLFNGEDDTRVAPEFLVASEDLKSVRVDDDVSQVVVSAMLDAKTLKTGVTLVGGRKVSHDIQLDGLDKAVEWVDCAQAR